MDGWLIFVIVAVVVLAAVAVVVNIRRRRSRQTQPTMGLPELGAISGTDQDAVKLGDLPRRNRE